MSTIHRTRVAAFLMGLLPGFAGAAAVTASTGALAILRECTIVDDKCVALGPAGFFATAGHGGDTSASIAVALGGYGTADANVSLSGTIGAPLVRSSAAADPGRRSTTSSIALQRYTYTGIGDSLRTFDGMLTYAQHLTGPHAPDIADGIIAFIDVFTAAVTEIEVGDTADSNFQTMIVGVNDLPGFASLGRDTFMDRTSTDSGLASLSVSVLLHPGDTVWVRAFVATPTAHGAWVDASHTLLTAWSDAANLTPGAVAIPAPGTLALVFGGVLVARRPRRRE